jgi:hypothetical protein
MKTRHFRGSRRILGRLASGPPYFDWVFDPVAAVSGGSSGNAGVFVLSRSRLKAGCSQEWLPHNLHRITAGSKMQGAHHDIVRFELEQFG